MNIRDKIPDILNAIYSISQKKGSPILIIKYQTKPIFYSDEIRRIWLLARKVNYKGDIKSFIEGVVDTLLSDGETLYERYVTAQDETKYFIAKHISTAPFGVKGEVFIFIADYQSIEHVPNNTTLVFIPMRKVEELPKDVRETIFENFIIALQSFVSFLLNYEVDTAIINWSMLLKGREPIECGALGDLYGVCITRLFDVGNKVQDSREELDIRAEIDKTLDEIEKLLEKYNLK